MIPDGGLGLVERMDATGGLVELLMPGSGYETTCQVFNIPDETANTLTVRKTVCPEGFDGDENDAAMQCTAPMDGVTFLLGDEEATTGDAGPGTAVFMDVPAGDYEHSEIVPDGTGKVIYDGCYLNGAPAITIVLQGDPPVSLISFGEGDHWECRWYNVPEVSFDVVIHKQVCAPNVEFVPANAIPDFATIDALCPEEMDGIPFTIDHAEGTDTSQTVDGTVTFADVPAGEFSLSEEVPSGFLQPLWYCSFAPAGGGALPAPEFVVTPGGVLTDKLTDPAGGTYVCFVFNVPDDNRIVTVWKWACPAGLEAESEDFQDWADTCANHPPSIDFTVTDADGDVTKPLAGMAWWAPVAAGDVVITEHTPPGYQAPIVFCGLEAYSGDGAAFAEGMTMMAVDGSSVSRTLDHEFFSWECHFFNIPHDSGDITIRKFDCPTDLPAPYDPYAPGADPQNDCALASAAYDFVLAPPVGPDMVQTTGDVVPSGVYFADLAPGDYVVTEDVPPGVHSVFIWNCTGSNIPAVHPTPLSVGPVFAVTVAEGDQIVCNWFNVYPPDDGSVTVHKYLCSTPVFVSEIDCETYEFGVAFELIRSVDDASYGVTVTDATGTATWWPVEPGVVQLVELEGEACHIEMSQDDGNGNPMVDMGEQTVIDVYNCSDDPSTPGGKIPQEYPNTGVPSSFGQSAPLMQDATPRSGTDDDAYFVVRCLEDVATPVPGTEQCPRGAVPEHIDIDAIGVDHDVEILEVIDGVMQAPTGPDVASWYKETGRLGERNNTVIAGHLNYWGVPEGIFFSLHSLQAGDQVQIVGNDGRTYVYEVEWTRMESNLVPPAAEIVGATEEPSLTLITCGGSWNAAISEYDQRTVVRAVLVDVVPGGQEPSNN